VSEGICPGECPDAASTWYLVILGLCALLSHSLPLQLTKYLTPGYGQSTKLSHSHDDPPLTSVICPLGSVRIIQMDGLGAARRRRRHDVLSIQRSCHTASTAHCQRPWLLPLISRAHAEYIGLPPLLATGVYSSVTVRLWASQQHSYQPIDGRIYTCGV